MYNPNASVSTLVHTAAILLSLAWLPVAGAQTSAPETANSSQESDKLETITVTATKRAQSLQEVPLAVTALTEERLREIGATEFDEYFRTVPGLAVVDLGPNNKKYVLRGLNAEFLPRGDAIVQQYVDDFPLNAGSSEPDFQLHDMERVEILRGPQGTLYGSGSMGGTIKNVTHKPVFNKFEGYAEGSTSALASGGQNWSGNAVINIPLIDDKLAARVVGYIENAAGYIDNVLLNKKDVNSSRTKGYRGILSWQANQNLRLTGYVFRQRFDLDDGTFQTPDAPAAAAGEDVNPSNANPPFDFVAAPFDMPATGRNQTRNLMQQPSSEVQTLYNTTLNWNLGFAELTSASTWYNREQRSFNDEYPFFSLFFPDNLPLTLGATSEAFTKYHSFNQEVRLVSNGDKRLSWVLGGFYYDTHAKNVFYDRFPDGNMAIAQAQTFQRYQTAGFGEVSYAITEKLLATVGGRYGRNKHHNNGMDLFPFEMAFGPGLRSTDNADSEKFNLKYQLSPNSMVYFNAASGFRAGGANGPDPVSNQIGPAFKSDSLWNYEIGGKVTWLDGRLVTNAALFYIDWSDMQVSLFNGVATDWIYNVGKARSQGLEFEGTARVARGFDVTASFAFIDAELAKDMDPTALQGGSLPGRKGDRLPLVPRVSGSLQLSYNHRLNQHFDGFVTTLVSYVGSSNQYFRPDDPFNTHLSSYSLVTLRTGLRMANDLQVTLYGNNLTDERAVLSKAPSSYGYSTQNVWPRTVGVSISKKF